jgi:hypothetical protein
LLTLLALILLLLIGRGCTSAKMPAHTSMQARDAQTVLSETGSSVCTAGSR